MATYGDSLDFPAFFTPKSGFKVQNTVVFDLKTVSKFMKVNIKCMIFN